VLWVDPDRRRGYELRAARSEPALNTPAQTAEQNHSSHERQAVGRSAS
jgi:hypothetical protein